ncbi:hypothetical protein [Lichenicoccus sp.]|uniref:hypothetical protein n=1 Tax=Lichenicoccus sp. TaxID=2781899 RepID=UPI003D0CBB80
MSKELIEALQKAGAVDSDVHLLARTDVSVQAAVIDLQGRYPAAFKPPFDARTAPKEEVEAWFRRHTEDMERETQRRRNEAALADMERLYGKAT